MSIERKRLDAAGADTVRRASTRRFAALLLAQACLLLGSVVLCFAYPLYVLDETGSATAYGLVGRCLFFLILRQHLWAVCLRTARIAVASSAFLGWRSRR